MKESSDEQLRALMKICLPYLKENRAQSWWALVSTLVVLALSAFATFQAPLWLALPLSIWTGLVLVRLFVLYHDWNHGAILRDSTLGAALMSFVGLFLLRSPRDWSRSHNFHHLNNARFDTSAVGSFKTMDVVSYRAASPGQRRAYRIIRSPLVIVFGYVTCFLVEGAKKLFFRDTMLRVQSALSLLVHGSFGYLAWKLGGAHGLVLGFLLPFSVSCGTGALLFYVQHNFPTVRFRPDSEWDYLYACLNSSSVVGMPKLLHWLTGNIAFHATHHLNPKIPFYHLPEATAAIEAVHPLQRFAFNWSNVRACLELKLWDPQTGRMVVFPRNAELELATVGV